MERFLWKGQIYPGKIEEYIDKHDNIWPEMIELMKKAGLRNYSIWNSGNNIIGYYEYDGPVKKQEVYSAHKDLLRRWNESMHGVMEMDKDERGEVLVYRQVFLME